MATSNPYITNPVISIKEAMGFLPNDLYSVKPVSFNDATQEWQKITSNDLTNDARNLQNQQQELELQNQQEDKNIQDKIANDLQQKFGTDTDTTDTDEKYKEMLSYAEKEYIMKGRVDKAYKFRQAQNDLNKINQSQKEYIKLGSDLYAVDKTTDSFTKVIDTPDKVDAPKLGSLETLYDRDGNRSYVYKNSPEYLDAIQNKGLVPESAYKQDFERRKTIEENKAFNPNYTPSPELSQSVFDKKATVLAPVVQPSPTPSLGGSRYVVKMPNGDHLAVEKTNSQKLSQAMIAGGSIVGESTTQDDANMEQITQPESSLTPTPSPTPEASSSPVDWSKIDPKYDSVVVKGTRYRRP